jgi:hypothetical protein
MAVGPDYFQWHLHLQRVHEICLNANRDHLCDLRKRWVDVYVMPSSREYRNYLRRTRKGPIEGPLRPAPSLTVNIAAVSAAWLQELEASGGPDSEEQRNMMMSTSALMSKAQTIEAARNVVTPVAKRVNPWPAVLYETAQDGVTLCGLLNVDCWDKELGYLMHIAMMTLVDF